MTCWYRPKTNQLWSLWYCVIVLLLHAYLLYTAVHKYGAYVSESSMKRWRLRGSDGKDDADVDAERRGGLSLSNLDTSSPHFSDDADPDGGEAPRRRQSTDFLPVAFVALHGAVLALMPLFAAAGCLKVGNLSNDGDRLGARCDRVISVSGFWLGRKIKSVWQHGPPVAQTVHLLMAFLILFADVLIEAPFFQYKIYNTENHLWSTELDFIFHSSDSSIAYQPAAYPRHHINHSSHINIFPGHIHAMTSSRSAEVTQSAVHRHPKQIAVVLYSNAFGLSIEFVNYVFALLIFAAVYSSTFWRCNKWFGFLFSLHLLVNALASILAYIAFKLLYRAHYFDFGQRAAEFKLLASSTKNSASHQNQDSKPTFLLDDKWLIVIYVLTLSLTFLASAIVYGYGYCKFCIGLWIHNSRSRLRSQKTYTIHCEGYAPHISAIVMLVLLVAGKSPLLYDEMILYQHSVRALIVACVVGDVIYLFCWILLWLVLTLLRDWDFKTRHTVGELSRMEGLRATDAGNDNVKSSSLSENGGLFLMCGDEIYATDEELKKAALLRLAEKCSMGRREDDIYWLKPHNGASGSIGPGQKRRQSLLNSHETNYLLSPIGGDQSPQTPTTPLIKKSQQPSIENAYYKNPESIASPKAVVRYPSHRLTSNTQTTVCARQSSACDAASSGTYVRFNEVVVPDHSEDTITTFGTMPRNLRHHSSDDARDSYGKHINYKPMLARHPDPLAYASVHKRQSPSRTVGLFPTNVQTLSYQRQGCLQDDGTQCASRGSSYANVSNLHATTKPQTLWTADAAAASLERPYSGKMFTSQQNAGLPAFHQQQRPSQADRHPSYSSIQSQQLAAAYSPSPTSNDPQQRRHFTGSGPTAASPLIKSPTLTSYSNPVSSSSKVSSLSDAGDEETTATITRAKRQYAYDSSVTLVESSPPAFKNTPTPSFASTGAGRPSSNAARGEQKSDQRDRLADWQNKSTSSQQPTLKASVVQQLRGSEFSPPKPPVSSGLVYRGASKALPQAFAKNNTLSFKYDNNREKSDSANFSLTSSNESENHYVTSVV